MLGGRMDGLGCPDFPLPAPAEQTECAEAGAEERECTGQRDLRKWIERAGGIARIGTTSGEIERIVVGFGVPASRSDYGGRVARARRRTRAFEEIGSTAIADQIDDVGESRRRAWRDATAERRRRIYECYFAVGRAQVDVTGHI